MSTHETAESPEPNPSPDLSPNPIPAVDFDDAGSSDEPGPVAESKARRSPRTVTLLVGALLLGPLLGAGIGYTVQADRPATPLPSLHVAAPSYPTIALDAEAAAEAAPKPLAIDGDLRKLLISKPDGADDWDNYGHGDGSGWLTVGAKAGSYGGADKEFTQLVRDGFRRDAVVAWTKGGNNYRVELIQFDADHAYSAIDWTERSAAVLKLDGTVHGTYLVRTEKNHFADSTNTYYFGSATARRGNVVMVVGIYSQSQVSADELKGIAAQQWERLV
ncbi:hypothetical protein [Saccharothrix sp. ST-888]|uniref:hypothetical protein n=1 Tax=Saccharothrix sp. ST-888 TaxID=1427391 RepID=UPI0006964E1F|nr:hypothetical protein [Saccharothrix sp. ST-888]